MEEIVLYDLRVQFIRLPENRLFVVVMNKEEDRYTGNFEHDPEKHCWNIEDKYSHHSILRAVANYILSNRKEYGEWFIIKISKGGAIQDLCCLRNSAIIKEEILKDLSIPLNEEGNEIKTYPIKRIEDAFSPRNIVQIKDNLWLIYACCFDDLGRIVRKYIVKR